MRVPAVLGGCLGVFLGLAAVAPAAPVPITTCGQSVEGVAELAGDLDCSAFPGPALTLRGTLELRGHTLVGHPGHDVVYCPRRCLVRGPGTVTGGAGGVADSPFGLVPLDGQGTVAVVDASVVGNRRFGVNARRGRVVRSTIADSEVGLVTSVGTVAHSTITDTLGPVHATKLVRLDGATIRQNRGPLFGRLGVIVRRSEITENTAEGIYSLGAVRILDSIVSGNGRDGVRSLGFLAIGGSTLVGNGADPGCGVEHECADIASPTAPRVSEVTCGTSRNTADGGTWGVCADD
jgi:hypothetical protein